MVVSRYEKTVFALLVWVPRAPEMEFYRIYGGFSNSEDFSLFRFKSFLGHYPEASVNDKTKTLL